MSWIVVSLMLMGGIVLADIAIAVLAMEMRGVKAEVERLRAKLEQ